MKIIVTESQIREILSESDAFDNLNNIKGASQLKTIANIMATPDAEEETSNITTPDNNTTPNKKSISKSQSFIHPLGKKFRVSSGFNEPRGNKKHNSVDIAAPTGTPVYAPANGMIVYSGDIGGRCGGHIKIHHGDIKTKYCHLSKWVVNRGRNVRQGQLIGYVGGGANDPHKGASTGSHLHYEIVSKSGSHINPEQRQFGFA